jgi:hypothetical protein
MVKLKKCLFPAFIRNKSSYERRQQESFLKFADTEPAGFLKNSRHDFYPLIQASNLNLLAIPYEVFRHRPDIE